jgi:DNA-binding LytR/AlgR family response regulator
LIVEDEPLIADNIAFILEDEGYEVIGKAIDTEEAIAFLEHELPDLLLLDISLDGDDEDGVDLAHTINNNYQVPFVFITSHADKLTINRVKKTNPKGFIIKPFKPADILSTLAIVFYKNKTPQNTHTETSFFVKQGHDLIRIQFKDILYIKAEDNFTSIVLADKKILASLSLKAITDKLPTKMFYRIHRSYIININKIDRISDRFVYVFSHEIPLGKTYNHKFKKHINTLY